MNRTVSSLFEKGSTDDDWMWYNVQNTLYRSIQGAAAMLRDDRCNRERTTKRIQMLLDLIGDPMDKHDDGVHLHILSVI